MTKIIKRNDGYYVQFYGNGLLFEKFAGKDRALAEKLLKEINDSLPQGAMSNFVPDQALTVFFDHFLKAFSRKYSETTLGQLRASYEALCAFAAKKAPGVTTLSGITPKVIEAYREYLCLEYLPEDINFQLFLLRCLFDFAISKMYLIDNPTTHIKPLQTHRPVVISQTALSAKLKDANASEELIIKYLLGDTTVSERLRLLKWKLIRDQQLKDALVEKLLKAQVPLIKIYQIFDVEDIRELKPYAGWIFRHAEP